MAHLIWLVPICPLVGAILNALVFSWLPPASRRRIAPWVAVLGSLLAFCAAVAVTLDARTNIVGVPPHYRDYGGEIPWIQLLGSTLTIPLGLRVDPLSIVMMLIVTGVGTLIHLFSVGYMADDERVGRYFTYLNLFMFAMLMLVLANNYPLMFLGWEGVGLCSFLLIGFWFERVSAAQAGKKAFLINRVGDFGFLLAMFALFWTTGMRDAGGHWQTAGLVFNDPVNHLGALDRAEALSNLKIWGFPAVTVICLLFFLACTGKSAQLPLYMWLPDAMEGPTPVSALIHAATMVTAGVYLIARSAPLFSASPFAQHVVAWVGIITALYAAILAIKQYDIKRVLAYSTVSQLGYMFVGVGVGAYAAGISHLMTHAFFKALMFLGAGAVMHALEGQLDMRKMGNVRKYMPITFITFACGWLAISGFPLTSGFFSKDYILDSAEHHGYMAVYWIGVVVAAMTAFYMTRMFITVFLGPERIEMGDEGHGGDAQEHGKSHAAGHAGHGHPHHEEGSAHHHAHGTHDHGHAHVHPEQAIMNAPLIVLGILSLLGGFLVPMLYGWLEPILPHAIHAAEGAAGAGEEAFVFNTANPMAYIPTVAGLLGIAIAWFGFGPEKFARGWTASQERALGFLQDTYDGFWHLVVVRGGTALSNALFQVVDRWTIDNLVNGTGKMVEGLAESLRTLQTGYVRNYALVMLAGAVFVVACFMVILQNTAR